MCWSCIDTPDLTALLLIVACVLILTFGSRR